MHGRHGIRLLYDEPLELDGVAVTGVEVERGVPCRSTSADRAPARADGLVVVVALPGALRGDARGEVGLPYAGDLINRGGLEAELQGRPALVLCGHIHARCTAQAGPLLQFTVGAMIEPPFDATLVEIDPAGSASGEHHGASARSP